MIKKASLCLLIVLVFSAWGLAGDSWNEVKSNHFIVYYKKTPKDFAQTVIKAAESYYDEIIDNLGFHRHKGWSFDNRAKIYIYDSQEDYIESARQLSWSSGAAYYLERAIRTYPSAAGFFDSLLPHELGHIIFHEFIGTHVRIPTWFDEGVAMYQEKAKRWGSNEKVKRALADGTFMPLPRLNNIRLTRDTPQEMIELFYAESASVVSFLINDQGEFKFSILCRTLKGGDKFNYAIGKVYPRFKNLDGLNDAWVSYLERQ